MPEFSHFNSDGRARMVDVGGKEKTIREAEAEATVIVNPATMGLILTGGIKKGDVFAVAQVAGIMAAKKTPDIIPMCHPIALTGVDMAFSTDMEKSSIHITVTVRCTGETGVEMEALTAASVAALTVYDMCKAVQKDIEITDVRLLRKSGGKSGDFIRHT